MEKKIEDSHWEVASLNPMPIVTWARHLSLISSPCQLTWKLNYSLSETNLIIPGYELVKMNDSINDWTCQSTFIHVQNQM